MNREIVSTKKLQLLYLSTSLFSTYCVVSNRHLTACANLVGMMCLFDFWFIKKKDMILHHVFVIVMLHYMNNHTYNPNRNQIMSVILSTEMSTIFLTLNNLLENASSCSSIVRLKQMNKLAFVSSFVYYRIYNYSYYLLNTEVQTSFLIYSVNPYDRWEICGSIYGLFLLNVYWTLLIVQKVALDRTCNMLRRSKRFGATRDRTKGGSNTIVLLKTDY